MYIHVDMLEGKMYECYLNGVREKAAFAASEEEGWVYRWSLSPEGKPMCTPWCSVFEEDGVLKSRNRQMLTEKVYGKVELRLKAS